MRYAGMLSLALALLLTVLGGAPAGAHRVGVFCWMEQGELRTQSSFQPGGPVRGGRVQLVVPATGEVLGEGKSDLQGECTLIIPSRARKEKLDLRVLLLAGTGHKGSWELPAADYIEGFLPAASSPVSGVPETPVGTSSLSGVTSRELQELLDRELEVKLAPIRRTLAQMQESRPSLSDVLGGIGYIFGIMGIVLYFKSKKSV